MGRKACRRASSGIVFPPGIQELAGHDVDHPLADVRGAVSGPFQIVGSHQQHVRLTDFRHVLEDEGHQFGIYLIVKRVDHIIFRDDFPCQGHIPPGVSLQRSMEHLLAPSRPSWGCR